MSMPSITELLVILGIVALVFGTSRLRGIGSDLGAAIRGFRGAMKDDSSTPGASGQSGMDSGEPDGRGR
ncbi:MAG TPA: twin-arginine translocase subunit TatA [Gammaproteobacteria bacterium]|nr:twin-arginine translocase subunit TatA [Gammaproteobacteria bacterium]